MEAAIAHFVEALAKDGNLALMLSFMANVAMALFIWMTRKEDRQDRAAAAAALRSVAEALDKVRIVVAANSGNQNV